MSKNNNSETFVFESSAYKHQKKNRNISNITACFYSSIITATWQSASVLKNVIKVLHYNFFNLKDARCTKMDIEPYNTQCRPIRWLFSAQKNIENSVIWYSWSSGGGEEGISL